MARVGGDEFALLLKFCSLKEAERICDLLLESIGDFRFMWENIVFDIGASIGLVPVDAGADVENNVLPHEAKVANALEEQIADSLRLLEVAELQQQRELVATHPGDRVDASHSFGQHFPELPEQFVTRHVSAGIVDHFELV